MNSLDIIDILIVEDNESDAELALRALRKRNLANHVRWVQDGEEALSFLFKTGQYAHRQHLDHPKVVLLDLKLPKIHGLQVLRLIRENEMTKKVPVVVFTSSNEDPDIANAYELGANSYVVKPISFDSFTNVMSNLGFYWLMLNAPPARPKTESNPPTE